MPERNGNHVGGNEAGYSDAHIKTVGNDIDQSAFRDQIDSHVGITTKKLQYKRHDAARRKRRSIYAYRSRGRIALRSNDIQPVKEILKRPADLLHEQFARIGERNAPRRAIEQTNAETGLELADRIAEGGCRYAEINGSGAKSSAPRDGDNSTQVVEAKVVHCPVFRNSTSPIIPLIYAVQEYYVSRAEENNEENSNGSAGHR